MKRTNTCGELSKKNIKKMVCLQGWVNSRRDHGGVIFIDLRDRYGITQVVFDPKFSKETHKEAEGLRRECVISVNGVVKARKKGMENKKIGTGDIEVFVDNLEILNRSEVPPIEIDDRITASDDLRLEYRYLDLRRQIMQKRLLLRHKAAQCVREYFNENNFIEVETPLLMKSTPEGARDYVVPSRVNPGKFYALPQSPQLYKQTLMIAGFDRYYQLAKCLRDEDLRADRQPEFTQIDVEMSFVNEEDIFSTMEGLMKHLWKKILNINLKTPFLKLSYEEATNKYGTDKPDLRFGLELVDVTDIAKDSDFEIFRKVTGSGGCVKAINAKSCGNLSRGELDEMAEVVKNYDAKGLSWMKVTNIGLESNIAKFFNDKTQKELIKKLDAKKNDLLLFVADNKHFVVNNALGNLRLHLEKKLHLIKNDFNFLWVTDFPLVEYDEDQQRYVAIHHPFTSPRDEDIKLLDKDPVKVKAKAYDLVLNGVEIGGGSIRIHKREIQEKMFSILGISKKEAELKFGFLLKALQFGCPPHGGIAFGFDRVVAIMCGLNDIREVIAFPKNKAAQNPMDGSPSEISEEQLKELNIKLDTVKK